MACRGGEDKIARRFAMLQGHLGWMRRISWPLSIQIYLVLLQQQVEIPSQVSFAQADREKLAVCMAGGAFHWEMFIVFIFQGNSPFSSNHNTLLFKQGFSRSPAKKCIC